MSDSHRETDASTAHGPLGQPGVPLRDSSFQTLQLNQVQGNLLDLYERIACERGRVEIIDGDGGCACVLISKAELDSLETAIAVLSDGAGVRSMEQALAQLAASITTEPAQA